MGENHMKQVDFEKQVQERIFEEFNGLETTEEAAAFAEFAVFKLKQMRQKELTSSIAPEFVKDLSLLLHTETHSIYGSGVFDYPMEEATKDANRILGII